MLISFVVVTEQSPPTSSKNTDIKSGTYVITHPADVITVIPTSTTVAAVVVTSSLTDADVEDDCEEIVLDDVITKKDGAKPPQEAAATEAWSRDGSKTGLGEVLVGEENADEENVGDEM